MRTITCFPNPMFWVKNNSRVNVKENETIDKYPDLAGELRMIWIIVMQQHQIEYRCKDTLYTQQETTL